MTVFAGVDMEKGEHFSTAGESANLYILFGIQYGDSSGNGNQSTTRSSNSSLRHIPKVAHSYNKDIISRIFTAALFVIARNWM